MNEFALIALGALTVIFTAIFYRLHLSEFTKLNQIINSLVADPHLKMTILDAVKRLQKLIAPALWFSCLVIGLSLALFIIALITKMFF
jgi:hypothetical protein